MSQLALLTSPNDCLALRNVFDLYPAVVIQYNVATSNFYPPTFSLSAQARLVLAISINSGLSDAPPTRNPSRSGCVPAIVRQRTWAATTAHTAHTELLAVFRIDGPAINDAHLLRDARRDRLGEPRTRRGVYLLRLCGSRDLARADRPDGLVRDDDVPERTSAKNRTPPEQKGGIRCKVRRGVKTYAHCAGSIAFTTAVSCDSTTACVWPASRSVSVSPAQRMILRPASRAARVFFATSSEVS
jgi:hypothetical protein